MMRQKRIKILPAWCPKEGLRRFIRIRQTRKYATIVAITILTLILSLGLATYALIITYALTIDVQASYIQGDVILQNEGFEHGLTGWKVEAENMDYTPLGGRRISIQTSVEVVSDSFEGSKALMIDGIGATIWANLTKEVPAEGCMAYIAVRYIATSSNWYHFFVIIRGQTMEGETLIFGIGDAKGDCLASNFIGSGGLRYGEGVRYVVTTNVASTIPFTDYTVLSLDVESALSNSILMKLLARDLLGRYNSSLSLDISKSKVIGVGFAAQGSHVVNPQRFRFFADAVTIFSPHVEQARVVTKIRPKGIFPLDVAVAVGGLSIRKVDSESVTIVTPTDGTPESLTIYVKPRSLSFINKIKIFLDQ